MHVSSRKTIQIDETPQCLVIVTVWDWEMSNFSKILLKLKPFISVYVCPLSKNQQTHSGMDNRDALMSERLTNSGISDREGEI